MDKAAIHERLGGLQKAISPQVGQRFAPSYPGFELRPMISGGGRSLLFKANRAV